jgi:tetratricopeptide (TPR) repeat protein
MRATINTIRTLGLLLILMTPAQAIAATGLHPEDLESHARLLETERASWAEAAELYRQAAGLRSIGDPTVADNLQRAGFLSYYLQDWESALADFSEAAEAAHGMSDVLVAARAYLHAAWSASRLGDVDQMESLQEQATALGYDSLPCDTIALTVLP